jgi:hypothetical protein
MATRTTYTSPSDYAALLRDNRPFLLLLLGEVRDFRNCSFKPRLTTRVTQIANQFGSWFNFVACFKLVQDLTGQVGIALSAVVVVRSAPRLLCFVVAGGVVDTFNRAHVLIVSSLLQALVVLALPLVQVTRSIWCAPDAHAHHRDDCHPPAADDAIALHAGCCMPWCSCSSPSRRCMTPQRAP